MLNQKIQNPNPDELMIEIDLCYELDPYELKLDEMIEAEPEPEMIEGPQFRIHADVGKARQRIDLINHHVVFQR